jgi:hypothetical protein
MANPNKAAGYKRKMALIAEECRPTMASAEEWKADWVREYKNTLRNVIVKITAFKVGPRPFTRPGVTKQAYNFMVRAYEKDTQ